MSCEVISEITIDSGVTTLGMHSFNECTVLKTININSSTIADLNSSDSRMLYRATTVYVKTGLEVGSYITDSFTSASSSDKEGYVKYVLKDSGSESDEPSLEHDILIIEKQDADYVVTGVKSKNFTEVTIPNFVTSIGKDAFRNCSGLTSITIPDSVTSIGYYAFYDCSGLTSVTIPDSVTSIGSQAFYGCSGLTGITVSENNSVYHSVDNCLIETATGALIKVCNNSIIPTDGSVTRIGDFAFSGCSGLTSITIPDSVTSIGWGAFHNCSGLTSITIPDSVTSIGEFAFYNCSGLTEVYITDLAKWCNIDFGASDANPLGVANPLCYAQNLYLNGNLVSNLIIPNSVTSIGNYVFEGCSGITSITIPDSVTNIGRYAFYYCRGLTSITIPDSVTSINYCAFNNCSNLKTVIIDSSEIAGLTSSDSYLLDNAKTVYVKTGLAVGTYITNAFKPCSYTDKDGYVKYYKYYKDNEEVLEGDEPDLEHDILNIVKQGDDYVVTGVKSMDFTEITIPDFVTVIGKEAFFDAYGNCKVRKITFGQNLKVIDDGAFAFCMDLISVVIPEGLERIGAEAFRECYKLIEIYNLSSLNITPGDETSYLGGIGYYARDVYTSLDTPSKLTTEGNIIVYADGDVRRAVAYIGDSDNGSAYLNNITEIGFSAFAMKSLKDIHIYNTTKKIEGAMLTLCNVSAIYYHGSCAEWNQVVIDDNNEYLLEAEMIFDTGHTYVDGTCTICGEIISLEHDILIIEKQNSDYVVTGVKTKDFTEITIPNYITKIGDRAFDSCSKLTDITIPNSITSVGNSAFSSCNGLENITLHNNIASIGNWAFANCSKLTSITIPTNISNIGEYTFTGCIRITNITIPESVINIDNNAFSGCTGLISINIGSNVKNMGNYTFCDCSGLTSITIPDSVTSIGNGAFSNCSGLTSVTIGNGVTSIGEDAFYGCSGLTSVTIGNGVMSIGENAFWSCYKLVEVYNLSSLNITISSNDNGYVGYYALDVYTSLDTLSKLSTNEDGYIIRTDGDEKVLLGYTGNETELVLPSGIMSIYQYAFWGCSGLTSITIPDSVTSIGEYAFRDCSGLTAVYITDLAKWCNINFGSSNTNPLYYAHNLYLNGSLVTDLVIPNSVTRIGRYTFYGCSGLTSITIPDSVTSIGWYAFADCSGLTSITVAEGNSVYHSDGNCLIETATGTLIAGCKNSIIPTDGSVTSIGEDAFYGCSGLKNVVIDSDTIAVLKTPNSFFSNNMLLSYAETVYVKEGLEVGSYITDSFTLAESSDMDGYVKYVK